MGAHAELAPGAQIGRFTVLKKLGAGGMGVVHLAYDPELDRRVAIKLLHDTEDDDLARARLRREAQAMAKLAHPNVVAVYEVGDYEGTLFVAMEYVQGVTLRAWAREKERTERAIVGVLAQAGRGLAAAHAAGLLHRDFKPDNVVVDEDGRVRVLDFGLARAVSDLPPPSTPSLAPKISDSDQTLPNLSGTTEATRSLVAGTPAYMGPEQIFEGKSDERSDQFAFCVTLYEALGGVRPYDRETAGEAMAAKKHGRVAAPKRPIRPRLRAILVRGLHPDPAQRWPQMGALVDALEGAMRRATPLAIGAVASVVVLVLATTSWAALRPAKPAMCKGLDRELAGVWDDGARDGAARGLRATKHKNAEATIARVLPALDAYAAAWTAMSIDACEDARVRGTQSMDTLDLRTACLDQRAKELRATGRILASADANVVDRAVKMVDGLSPIDGCADLAALREPTAPPRDPGKRAAASHVRDLVAQAKALYSSGRYDACDPIASDAVAAARLAGAHALEAEALHWRALVAFYREGGAKAAASAMLDAAIAAEAARHDAFAAESWTWLTHYTGYVLDRPADAEPYARLAAAAIERRGGDPLASAHLLKVRANVLYGQGKREEAMALYREGIALLDQSLGPAHPRSALARLDVGDDYYDHGDRAGALATYRGTADVLVRAYGESAPDTQLVLQRVAACEVALALPTALDAATRAHDASTYDDPDVEDNLGQALVLAGRSDEGIAHLRRAIERAPALLDANQVVTFSLDLARALLRRGDVPGAGAEIARVQATTSPAKLAQTDAFFAVRALYEVRAGRAKDAAVDAAHARAIEHESHQDEIPDAALADLALGEAKLALHAPADAREPLDHALAIADKGFDPVLLADMRADRARARAEEDPRAKR